MTDKSEMNEAWDVEVLEIYRHIAKIKEKKEYLRLKLRNT